MSDVDRRAVLAGFAALAGSGALAPEALAALNAYIVMGPDGEYYFLTAADLDAVMAPPDKPCKIKDCMGIFTADQQVVVTNVGLQEFALKGEASEALKKAIPDEALLGEIEQAIKERQKLAAEIAEKLNQFGVAAATSSPTKVG